MTVNDESNESTANLATRKSSASAAPSPWHEAFNNVAGAIQSIALTAAVIVAGVWALYTFAVIQQPVAEGQLKELKLKTALQGMLDLGMDVKQIRDASGLPFVDSSGHMYVVIDVAVKNTGNKNVGFPIDRKDTGLTFAKVQWRDPDGTELYERAEHPVHSDPGQRPGTPDASIGMEANGVERLTYLIRPTDPGVYCAVFRAPVPSADIVLKGERSVDPMTWRAKRYFLVEDRQGAQQLPPSGPSAAKPERHDIGGGHR